MWQQMPMGTGQGWEGELQGRGWTAFLKPAFLATGGSREKRPDIDQENR